MRGPRRGIRWVVALGAVGAATGLAAVAGDAGTGAEGRPAPAAFRLADGSAGCRLVGASTLACRSTEAEAAAVLDADGASRAEDVEVAFDATTPVLLPAESWWHGAFSCRVHDGAVRCAAGDGAITVATGAAGGVR